MHTIPEGKLRKPSQVMCSKWPRHRQQTTDLRNYPTECWIQIARNTVAQATVQVAKWPALLRQLLVLLQILKYGQSRKSGLIVKLFVIQRLYT